MKLLKLNGKAKGAAESTAAPLYLKPVAEDQAC
jgi:hypothetical protein